MSKRSLLGGALAATLLATLALASAGALGLWRSHGSPGQLGTVLAGRLPAELPAAPEEPRQRAQCDRPIAVWADGKRVDALCPTDLAAAGLTVVDLSDSWAPALFGGDDPNGPGYAARYRELAAEKFPDDAEGWRARDDRYLEPFGIFPTLTVLRARLLDDERHRCHDQVDDEPLARISESIHPWGRTVDQQRSDRAMVKSLFDRLDWGRQTMGLESVEQLAGDLEFGSTYAVYARILTRVSAIRAAQAHFRCAGLVGPAPRGWEDAVFDWRSTVALHQWQRRHMIVSFELDQETREALRSDSRELDFRALLRTLRERVADASGLLEDGSARGERGQVASRMLDGAAFLPRGAGVGDGAADLVSDATDVAARALGWTGPEAARAFLEPLDAAEIADLRIAVRLPPLPRYYAEHMELRAEIDRGDVWYDYPYTWMGQGEVQKIEKRPTLVLYAKDGERELALMRWPTTIGGWQPERVGPKDIRMMYKESDAGPRVWRDLLVTPVWIPPDSTPRRDLLRLTGNGYKVKRDLIGPSYASAYGLAMLIHHRVDERKNGEPLFVDQAIRTHGSVSYRSIHEGYSHGCHRLQNHLAVRLSSFLVRHRNHEVRGREPLGMSRKFAYGGRGYKLDIDSRGYRYELTPPVQVDVLPGRIRGHRQVASAAAIRLPPELVRRFADEMAE